MNQPIYVSIIQIFKALFFLFSNKLNNFIVKLEYINIYTINNVIPEFNIFTSMKCYVFLYRFTHHFHDVKNISKHKKNKKTTTKI